MVRGYEQGKGGKADLPRLFVASGFLRDLLEMRRCSLVVLRSSSRAPLVSASSTDKPAEVARQGACAARVEVVRRRRYQSTKEEFWVDNLLYQMLNNNGISLTSIHPKRTVCWELFGLFADGDSDALGGSNALLGRMWCRCCAQCGEGERLSGTEKAPCNKTTQHGIIYIILATALENNCCRFI